MVTTFRILISYISVFFSIFRSHDPSENIPSVTYLLLKYFKIKITYCFTKEFINSDQDYPSLKSICNFFDELSIIHYPLKLEERDLYDLDRPFLAHINHKGWKVILVYNINSRIVIYKDSLNGLKEMSLQKFLKIWDGVIIITETGSCYSQADYHTEKADEILSKVIVDFPLVLIFITVLYGLLSIRPDLNEKVGLLSVLIIFTHILGLVFSILLFRNVVFY